MSLLALFPLPTVVLFPDVVLPLHIFEPRYREMVADALAGDRRLGMMLLRPGWEGEYEGRPPIYPVGCSGVIVHTVKLDDGRYNIVLRGLERFRVVSENQERAYRRARIEPMPDLEMDAVQQSTLGGLRAALADRLGLTKLAPAEDRPLSAEQLAVLPDADFVNTLAQYLDLEPIEKQALLERNSVLSRAEALIDLLDMKRAMASIPGASDRRTH